MGKRYSTPLRASSSPPGPALEGLGDAVLGSTLTYLGAEAALPGPLHPVHWGITLLGGVIGYLIGQSLYHYKAGDGSFRGPRKRR